MGENKMKLLVVIVTYNAMQWIERCLNSVRNSSVLADMFVVDNGSIDGTQDYIKQYFPEAFFIQSEGNLGFGKANNQGLKYAIDNNYDYVYLLNQDAWVMYDTFSEILKVFDNDTEFGIVSPMQLEANESHLDKFFMKSVCTSSLIESLYFKNKKNYCEVEFVMAAHWMISSKCLKHVGGFSPTFSHYGEDNNYIDRAKYFRYKVGVALTAQAVHDRENRMNTLEKCIYLSYVQILKDFSAPEKKRKFMLARAIYYMIKESIMYRSIKPIHYLCKFLGKYDVIRSNRRKSMSEKCSFL